ncbi:MBL fold metallo-hydrolase [Clostridium sp.]|uniref:MBL fold metallo-hydrolase n=1 Tax=Clostridium sp. TaxID=1506 RepID=UPI001B59C060|nr:MBL fold metallo-hydrolase [Clostridium sp.]MBP3915624.1 MBL fold metallo-hydrolase [Clostridium sp.]
MIKKPIIFGLILISQLGFAKVNAASNDDKIHFIATGNSDAILIESNGKYGLIDAAEDTGTSRTRGSVSEIQALNGKGYEEKVVNYLKSVGVEKLEFAIATHAHSDHIGGMDTILSEFQVGKLYTREYKETYVNSSGARTQIFLGKYEYTWDNQEVYDDMINQAKKSGTNIVYVGQNSSYNTLNFSLGDFSIQIVNNRLYNTTEAEKRITLNSENANSLGVIVSKNDKRAFLAGDIENSANDNDEDFLMSNSETKDKLKNVDLLKMSHHGENGTAKFLNYLNPKYVVVTRTNTTNNISSINFVNSNNVYITGEVNDVVANFTDSGTIVMQKNISSDANWVKHSNGTWSYLDSNGKKVTGWQQLYWQGKKDWYYFNSSGIMVTGWQQLNYNGKTNWYYFDTSGAMATGWQKLNYNGKNSWFYFGNSGAMATGWQKLNYNGKTSWYYFDTSGVMATGWQKLNYNGKTSWFYFDSSGVMLTGWQQLNYNGKTNWYYFDNSGVMLTGSHQLYWNGVKSWYTFNSDGTLKN